MIYGPTSAAEVSRRKRALEAKLEELLETAVPREELQIEYLPDPLDQVASNSNREMALRAVDQKARLIQDVELALEALADGTYGVCEHCGTAIPPRRLDAVPWARRCVPCQEKAESRDHREDDDQEGGHHAADEAPAFRRAA